MEEKMFSLEKDPVLYAIPIFLVVIAIEVFLSWKQRKELYAAKDSAASLAMGLGSVFVNLFMKAAAFAAFSFLYQFRLFDFGWVWYVWVLCFFAEDFSFYIHHRLSHEIRVLWAAHVNHHSSQKLNYTTALRQSWVEYIYKYIFWLWLPLLGFEPIMVLTLMSFNLIYQFFTHTQLLGKLGPLEWVFNTPSHHRVHHGSNLRYLDRNHAGVLIIWDRLFGTFQEELDEEPPVYGITQNINTYNPLRIATHEYAALMRDLKKTSSWKNRLSYIFGAPGWSPDGPDLRAKTLRNQAFLNQSARGGKSVPLQNK